MKIKGGEWGCCGSGGGGEPGERIKDGVGGKGKKEAIESPQIKGGERAMGGEKAEGGEA